MNKVERMKELIATLNQASVLYYQYSTIMMTDYEYDKLYDELVELEKETGITLSNSPTINVEPEVSSSLKKVEHPSPMLSLAKTKNIDELEEFLGKPTNYQFERYLKLVENMENELVFKRGEEKVWICRNCGHITVGKDAPAICPVCKHPQSYMEIKAENY